MTIQLEVWNRPRESEVENKVTEAIFTFVAIDKAGKPRIVPDEDS